LSKEQDVSHSRTFLTEGDANKTQWFTRLLQTLRVVTTDVTQMTTLPSACKGLSFYAIAPLTQPWTNAKVLTKRVVFWSIATQTPCNKLYASIPANRIKPIWRELGIFDCMLNLLVT